MNGPTRSSTPAQTKRTLTIIWIAMIGALATYWALNAHVGHLPKTGTAPALLPSMLLVIAVSLYGMAWWWYQRTVQSVSEALTPTALQQLTSQRRLLLLNQLRGMVIVCLAFLEAPVILGLVNTMLRTPSLPLFEWCAVASFVGMMLLRARGFPTVFALVDRLSEVGNG